MWQWQGGAVGGRSLDEYGGESRHVASSYAGPLVEPESPRTSESRTSVPDPTLPGQRWGCAQDVVPGSSATVRGDWEPTPIFQAVASEWERHQRDDVGGHRRGSPPALEEDHVAWAPAPRVRTGPLPVQRPRDPGRTRDLPAVPAVPPPPPRGARVVDVAGRQVLGVAPSGERAPSGWVPEPRSGSGPLPVQRPRDASGRDVYPAGMVPPPNRSIDEELTRRAQRRRRPLATSTAEGGRHALKPRDGDEPTLREDLNTIGAASGASTSSEST
ncbi:hypothetical protein GCM10023203_31800 [Actinomycetospora straminea]|uniref:Uncharacterized protein n=1 Tax=Actinomycetospora straminea TaxID=663607 RepID=A0ABP9EH95_9PSEU